MHEIQLDGMNFDDFSKARAKIRAQGCSLDMAENNLYASLRESDPEIFCPWEPSSLDKAQYRCHVAELFLARWGWGEELKARASITQGVRQSLIGLFSMLAAQGSSALIPSDVYPEYQRLATLAGLRFSTYEARLAAPSSEQLSGVDAALICDPIKPWGGCLSQAQAKDLQAWVQADPESRLLIVDSAYAIDWTAPAKALVENGSALGLSSLSKGWLAPWTAGCAIAPEAWAKRVRPALAAFPKDESKLRLAFSALSDQAGRPKLVEVAVNKMAGRALIRLGELDDGFAPWGYMKMSARSADDWLRKGVLAMPASIFGSAWSGSVLSMLEPSASGR